MAGVVAREKAERNPRRRDGAGEDGADDISSGIPGVPQGVSRKTKKKTGSIVCSPSLLENPQKSDLDFGGVCQWLE